MNAIYVWGYLKEYEKEKEEVYAAIEKVLRSGKLILGESVSNFENEFSLFCGAKFGVGVNSATDGLFLGLKALGVGPGDEVITVSNTAVPTVCAIASTGATTRFVDIDPETYLMDVSRIEAAITEKTKCILPVHLFGQCVDMDAVNKIAKKHKLKVLEDCAQSHGAKFRGRMAGSMSDLSVFSFYPTKILGGYGDAGLIVTSNKDLSDHLKRLRFYGMEKTYFAIEHGYNTRLDELHAEILLRKLKHLPKYILRRQQLAKRYDQMLKDSPLKLPKIGAENEHAYYLYVCSHPQRDKIVDELKARNIFVNISYPWPIHTMPAYLNLGYREGSLPHTESAAKQIFSLPMYPTLEDEEQDRVISALLDIVKKL